MALLMGERVLLLAFEFSDDWSGWLKAIKNMVHAKNCQEAFCVRISIHIESCKSERNFSY